MRMFEGQVRTLVNVHRVPDLRKNLLSLGALEAQWCKFSGADGGIKVTKGSMMILKEERTTNLYKMTESIIICDGSVITEEDTTRLWHIRLGHMSEEVFKFYTKRVLYHVSNIANLIFVNFASWVNNVK